VPSILQRRSSDFQSDDPGSVATHERTRLARNHTRTAIIYRVRVRPSKVKCRVGYILAKQGDMEWVPVRIVQRSCQIEHGKRSNEPEILKLLCCPKVIVSGRNNIPNREVSIAVLCERRTRVVGVALVGWSQRNKRRGKLALNIHKIVK